MHPWLTLCIKKNNNLAPNYSVFIFIKLTTVFPSAGLQYPCEWGLALPSTLQSTPRPP